MAKMAAEFMAKTTVISPTKWPLYESYRMTVIPHGNEHYLK